MLTRHPELHQIFAGTRRLYPKQVDISVGTKLSATSSKMILEDAENKNRIKQMDEIFTKTLLKRNLVDN